MVFADDRFHTTVQLNATNEMIAKNDKMQLALGIYRQPRRDRQAAIQRENCSPLFSVRPVVCDRTHQAELLIGNVHAAVRAGLEKIRSSQGRSGDANDQRND